MHLLTNSRAEPTYQDAEKLTSTLGSYIDKVADFKSADFGGAVVDAEKIASRELQVAIPKGSMTTAQRKVFDAATASAEKKGVKLTVTEIQ